MTTTTTIAFHSITVTLELPIAGDPLAYCGALPTVVHDYDVMDGSRDAALHKFIEEYDPFNPKCKWPIAG